MKNIIETVEYVCDICTRRYVTEKEYRDCMYIHSFMSEGKTLKVLNSDREQDGIVIKVDHEYHKCLMELMNGERHWVGFYVLLMRNGSIVHPEMFKDAGVVFDE